jgi:translation initiation factor IF-2
VTKDTTSNTKPNNQISNVKLLNEQVKTGVVSGWVEQVRFARKDVDNLIALAKAKRDKLSQPVAPVDIVDTTTVSTATQSDAKTDIVIDNVQSNSHNATTIRKSSPQDNGLVKQSKPKPQQSTQQVLQGVQQSQGATKVTHTGGGAKPQPKQSSFVPKTHTFALSTKTTDARPSYVKGSYTPQPKPLAPMGQMTRERDFRSVNTTKIGVVGSMGGNRTMTRNPNATRPNFGNNTRPTNNAPRSGVVARPMTSAPSKDNRNKPQDKKKDYKSTGDNKMNKRTLIRKGFISIDIDDSRVGIRKLRNKKNKEVAQFVQTKIEKATITTENLTVKILSEKIGKTAQEIIKQLMLLGVMCTINSVVDFATAELVASELGIELELKLEKTKEETLVELHDGDADEDGATVVRSPVVAVMGHVDHGKTSLLDAIRSTNVMAGEAGGITQHIGAYTVETHGKSITFLDTPGHEAFTQMRARGAKVTDIAILVVAADDGVMPQTIEAIDHIKAAGVPMIVAINKMDKAGANPQKVKEMLSAHDVVSEDWGGDTIMVPVAAKQGEGIDKLLDNILFLAEYQNLRANPTRSAKGTIVESKMDKGKGPMATIIVQNGTLRLGDIVVSGRTFGRIKGMVDWKGSKVKVAGPSMAVSVLGFSQVPSAGDGIFVVEDEKLARQVVDERDDKHKLQQLALGAKVSLDDVFDKIQQSKLKDLNLIIKADVQGSAEALHSSLLKLSNDEVKVKIVHSGVGAISKSDIMLAEVSKSIILGFNIKPDTEAKNLADRSGIDIRQYKIIYEVIDDITRVVKGLEKPVYRDVHLGRVQVRHVFKLSSHGVIAGSYVLSGKAVRGAKVKVWRGSELMHEGIITSLKRFKEDVKEVSVQHECGISLDGYDKFKIDDEIEIYTQEQINI